MSSPVTRRHALALFGSAAAALPAAAQAAPSVPTPAPVPTSTGLPPGPFLVVAQPDGPHPMQVIGQATRYHTLLGRKLSPGFDINSPNVWRDVAGNYRMSCIRIWTARNMWVDEMFLYDLADSTDRVRFMTPKELTLAAGYNARLVPLGARMWHWRMAGVGHAKRFVRDAPEAMNLIPASAFAEVITEGQYADRMLRFRALRAVNHYAGDIIWSRA